MAFHSRGLGNIEMQIRCLGSFVVSNIRGDKPVSLLIDRCANNGLLHVLTSFPPFFNRFQPSVTPVRVFGQPKI